MTDSAAGGTSEAALPTASARPRTLPMSTRLARASRRNGAITASVGACFAAALLLLPALIGSRSSVVPSYAGVILVPLGYAVVAIVLTFLAPRVPIRARWVLGVLVGATAALGALATATLADGWTWLLIAGSLTWLAVLPLLHGIAALLVAGAARQGRNHPLAAASPLGVDVGFASLRPVRTAAVTLFQAASIVASVWAVAFAPFAVVPIAVLFALLEGRLLADAWGGRATALPLALMRLFAAIGVLVAAVAFAGG